MFYIHDLIKQEKTFVLSSHLICDLHKISFGWIFPKWAGNFRTIQVTFSGNEALPFYRVPELVTNLCLDLSERLHHLPSVSDETYIVRVVELLAWFQHAFVFIHPFQDYNGRMARMLTTFLLLSLNLPPMELKADTGVDRKRYLAAMQRADNGDYSALENLVSRALSEVLDRTKGGLL